VLYGRRDAAIASLANARDADTDVCTVDMESPAGVAGIHGHTDGGHDVEAGTGRSFAKEGFSNTGVLTVAALFPGAAGMYATGAISLLSQHVIGLPRSVWAAQLRILPPVALGSAFLNNTPLVAMMIPVVRDLTRVTGLARSKLFIGLSFASILGGTMTLIGTSVNLIIGGLVVDAMASGRLTGMKPLTIFEPIWVGLPATVAGLLFMMFIGTKLLPGD
jgi:di/tricarboxylate transporter